MKFICPTQMDRLTSFVGDTGIPYTSERGRPFEVLEPRDIAHFEKQRRIKKYTLVDSVIKKVAPPKIPEAKEEKKALEAWLDRIPGVSRKTVKAFLKKYVSVKEVYDSYLAGDDFVSFGKDGELIKEKINKIMEGDDE
jgi:hypothetical protein